MIQVIQYRCPLGTMKLVSDGSHLTQVLFPGEASPDGARELEKAPRNHPVFREAMNQLDEFFLEKREKFDLPLKPAGTEFQLKVWRELTRIPYGETRSYGELAKKLGKPKASRAVGAANGRNPLPIIIPCHRVIGSNGKLTGFAGGLDTKRILLELEGAIEGRS
jgi:methylated-DNA-[protein]-cysteine S-methyltransferase